jgi:hypothetical protein
MIYGLPAGTLAPVGAFQGMMHHSLPLLLLLPVQVLPCPILEADWVAAAGCCHQEPAGHAQPGHGAAQAVLPPGEPDGSHALCWQAAPHFRLSRPCNSCVACMNWLWPLLHQLVYADRQASSYCAFSCHCCCCCWVCVAVPV